MSVSASVSASVPPHLYRNQIGFSHLEPVLWPPVENPMLGLYTAAWFKVFLGGQHEAGQKYFDLIYSKTGTDTVFTYAEMKECVVSPFHCQPTRN